VKVPEQVIFAPKAKIFVRAALPVLVKLAQTQVELTVHVPPPVKTISFQVSAALKLAATPPADRVTTDVSAFKVMFVTVPMTKPVVPVMLIAEAPNVKTRVPVPE